MSEVIYSDLRLLHPSQEQENQELETSKKNVPSDCVNEDATKMMRIQVNCPVHAANHPAPSSSWKIIAVILGIISLALLSSVVYLIMSITNSFNAEGHPGNISSNKEANETEWKYPTCSKDWYQHGQNCYYLSKDNSLWKECDGYCTNLKSTFIKVDTIDEMDFLMKLVKMQCSYYRKFFISLYYNSTQSKWFLFDGTDFTKGSFKIQELAETGYKCIYIMNVHICADKCHKYGHCTCKKTIY